ncbi:hypothetical protein HOLleu_04100 [Holothuria leucospilota]|uniref:Immunoglobulin domain-containing protein n=1 Tax=Holothuria leucospilota TaxID=206669 RepID=A0A9Q1HM75_HOLLE|nr:hypothetical protein HOLleu_04100 [Holothuria leucospilota]
MPKTYFYVLWGTLLVTDCLVASSKKIWGLNSTRIVVLESESVLLECICGSLEGSFWKDEHDFIFVGSNLQEETLFGSFTLTNYSLYITSVQLLHEGEYQCWCNYSVQEKYELNVEVIPNLVFTVASSNITGRVLYLEENRNHSLMCQANGAKPPVNLKLMINGDVLNSSITKFWVNESSARNGTYDSVVELWIRPTDITGNISCIRSPQTISKEQHTGVSFVTYVIPRIFLSINGRSFANRSTYVEEGNKVLVRCKAEGARPAANLTLMISNISFESTYSSTRPYAPSFHTLISENLIIIQEHTLLTCIGRGEYGYAEQSVYTNIISFVSPKLRLSINGEHIPNGTTYNNTEGKWVLVICEAFGARPSVNLTILVNGTSFQYSNVTDRAKNFNESTGLPTFSTRAAINLSSAEGKLTITCLCICYAQPRREFYYIEMLTTELNVDISITAIAIVSSVFAVIVLSGFLYCSIQIKRRRRTSKKSVPR